MIKKILLAIAAMALIGVGVGYYMWNKPHPKTEDHAGIKVTAMDLYKEFTTNEEASKKKYLNQYIDVSGEVSEIEKKQDSTLMVVLKTDDPLNAIQCSIRDKGVTTTIGAQVAIRGKYSGYDQMTGVSLTECILTK